MPVSLGRHMSIMVREWLDSPAGQAYIHEPPTPEQRRMWEKIFFTRNAEIEEAIWREMDDANT